MRQALQCCICIAAFIQAVFSKGIHVPLSGSNHCQMTVRFTAKPVSTKYQSLEIVNTRDVDPRYSLLHCHAVSVKFVSGLNGKASFYVIGFPSKKDDNILQLTLQHGELHLPNIELKCKGKRCILSSVDNSEVQIEPQSYLFKRKLLAFQSTMHVYPMKSSDFSLFLAVAVVMALIITLAMCACGRRSDVEKTLSGEVGGTDVDQQVISVVRIRREENKDSELPQSEDDERRNTGNSQHSNNVASKDNGGENTTTSRAVSQYSQQGDIKGDKDPTTSNSDTNVFQASVSHGSIDKIESETLLKTTNPDNSEQLGNKEKVRSTSTKELSSSDTNSIHIRSFSQSDALVYKGNEGNIATSTKRNQPVHLISRKHSNKKDSKEMKETTEHDGREEHKGKRNWLRRKSSKNKSNVESQVSTPDHKRNSPTPGRYSALPLPPTPETKDPPCYIEEDSQYEAVEPRHRNPAPLLVVDNNYDSVQDVKRNSTSQKSRPASDLYECINDNESNVKRNSSESPEYDIVETKPKPHQVTNNPSSLEYTYTVVAGRDNLIPPLETSGGSGLYEVVTDDIKKLSGVMPTQVSTDDTYAVVQKDPSKHKKNRPLSDTDLAPAPPPVSSLRHVAVSSFRHRSQSEGDDLNVLADDRPSTHLLDRPHVEHTYAKVNKSLKKRSSDTNQMFMGETVISDGIEDDTPPPVPPSLYAELPVKDEDNEELHQDLATTIEINSLPPDNSLQNVDVPMTSVSSSRNSRVSVNSRNSQGSTNMTVFSSEYKTSSTENIIITVDNTTNSPLADTQSSDVNPLYQVIHYV